MNAKAKHILLEFKMRVFTTVNCFKPEKREIEHNNFNRMMALLEPSHCTMLSYIFCK